MLIAYLELRHCAVKHIALFGIEEISKPGYMCHFFLMQFTHIILLYSKQRYTIDFIWDIFAKRYRHLASSVQSYFVVLQQPCTQNYAISSRFYVWILLASWSHRRRNGFWVAPFASATKIRTVFVILVLGIQRLCDAVSSYWDEKTRFLESGKSSFVTVANP